MYDNVFCMIHGSLVGQILLPRICHLSIINEKKEEEEGNALKCALSNVNY